MPACLPFVNSLEHCGSRELQWVNMLLPMTGVASHDTDALLTTIEREALPTVNMHTAAISAEDHKDLRMAVGISPTHVLRGQRMQVPVYKWSNERQSGSPERAAPKSQSNKNKQFPNDWRIASIACTSHFRAFQNLVPEHIVLCSIQTICNIGVQ